MRKVIIDPEFYTLLNYHFRVIMAWDTQRERRKITDKHNNLQKHCVA